MLSGELCMLSGELCMLSGELCSLSGELCMLSGELCMLSVELCSLSGELCMGPGESHLRLILLGEPLVVVPRRGKRGSGELKKEIAFNGRRCGDHAWKRCGELASNNLLSPLTPS